MEIINIKSNLQRSKAGVGEQGVGNPHPPLSPAGSMDLLLSSPAPFPRKFLHGSTLAALYIGEVNGPLPLVPSKPPFPRCPSMVPTLFGYLLLARWLFPINPWGQHSPKAW